MRGCMQKFLSVTGFGNAQEEHFESGHALASEYFDSRNLVFLECYQAYEKDNKSTLGKHWLEAENYANLALYASNLQDCSMLELEIEDEDIF